MPAKRIRASVVEDDPTIGTASAGKVAGVSSEAVERKTGRGWEAWLDVLDRAGAGTMSHPEIAVLLREEHGLDPWWAQMVTVGYEQARLGRRPHEKPGGFEVGASRTVAVPLAALYRAWSDPRARMRWLPADAAGFTVRKATANKSMRITWVDGITHVDAHFYDKGAGKSQVTVRHKKLEGPAAAEKIKEMWAAHLAALKETLE